MAGNEQRPTDDVEGQRMRSGQATEAVDEDQFGNDAQGHGKYFQDTEATDEDQAADVEGHVAKCKEDTEATDDVAGHAGRYVGLDTEAVDEDQAGDDDTAGHATKVKV